MAENENEAGAQLEEDPAGAPDTVPMEAAGAGSGQQQLEQMQDRLLRSQAELENFRKRSRRELEDERKYANMPLMRDLVPVVDNIARAIAAAEKTTDANSLLEGFRMVAQQLDGVLERHHCKRINALHEPFDPNLHQAIMQQPSHEFPENTVVGVAEIGFQLHDRVVRPAQVIVSKSSG